MTKARPIEAAALATLAALATVMFLRPIWDIDIFWHIATGRWIWTHRAIPKTDIFGFDPQRPWAPFQWGYQVASYGLDQIGGLRLIRLVHVAAMLAAFGLLYRTYRRELQSPLAAFVVLLLTLMLWQDRINVRPHIFNLLGLAIMLPALLGGWRTAPPKAWLGWAAWMGIWANLHAGGCLILLVVLLAIPAGALLERGTDLRRAIGFWCLCALPALISPNFIAGNLHALLLVQTTTGTIGEWSKPLAFITDLPNPGPSRLIAGALPYATLLMLLGLGLTRRLRTLPPIRLGLLLAFSGLSLLYARFVHFAAPVWLILFAAGLPVAPGAFGRSVRTGIGLMLSITLVSLLWQTNIARPYGTLKGAIVAARSDIDARRFPVEAADLLEAIGFEGRVFCHARYGGYLLWRLFPKITVLVDGRVNVPPRVAEEVLYVHRHHRAQLTDPEIAHQIATIYNHFDADALVVETPAFTSQTMDCARWLPIFRDRKLEVFLRHSARNRDNLIRAGLTSKTVSSLLCGKADAKKH